MNHPNPTRGRQSEGAGRGHVGGVFINRQNNREVNLILQLLVFLMIRSLKQH